MLEADAPDAGHDFSDWVKANPCFEHYWYLSWYYRETGRKDKACEALADGAKYPLSRQNAPAFALQSFAYDAAAFAYRQERYQLTLDICDRWQAVDGLGGYAVDKSYLPMRAAAQLRLGHLEEARKTLALRTSQKQAIWARGVDELAAATDLGDRGFVYDPHEDESTAFKVFEWPPDDQ